MRRYSFTGPSVLGQLGELYVRDVVQRLNPPPSEITTGCATGVDTTVALAAVEFWHSATHRLVVPQAPHNAELVEFFENLRMGGVVYNVEIVRMPHPGAGGDDRQLRRKAYRQRNEKMVRAFSDELVAFLRNTAFYRSGEWMTVNIAVDVDVPVTRHLLP